MELDARTISTLAAAKMALEQLLEGGKSSRQRAAFALRDINWLLKQHYKK